MMARYRYERHEEEHENHERWLVSYADFITLLFAFFVVMYALSSVNEGKYRVLSDSMVTAFRHVQITPAAQLPIIQSLPVPQPQPVPVEKPKAENDLKQKQREKMRNVAKEIMQVMAPLVEQGKVRVIETSRGVSIEISDSVLFSLGQSALHPELAKAMHAVAGLLAPTDFSVTIQGHTDNVPIKTPQFPSNWELSAVRATTVLRLFVDAGVSPERLTATGYADTRPVESNALVEGRARNRRVNILVDSALPEQGEELGSSPLASTVPLSSPSPDIH